MSKLTHIMIDLETRGNVAGCGIVSFGAVVWDPHTGALGDEFYRIVNHASNEQAMLFDVPSTMAWWKKQSPEARKALEASEANEGHHISDVLREFHDFAMAASGHLKSKVRIWGNGADFDSPIVQSAWLAVYPTIDFPFPWGNRCYRTIKNLGELFGGPELPKMARTGTHHNALDDAKSQAAHMTAILQHITGSW